MKEVSLSLWCQRCIKAAESRGQWRFNCAVDDSVWSKFIIVFLTSQGDCSGWSGVQFCPRLVTFQRHNTTDMYVREQPGGRLSSRPVNRNWYCKLMMMLCIHASGASKVDVATQTEERDDSMKTEMTFIEPIVNSRDNQWDWWSHKDVDIDAMLLDKWSAFFIWEIERHCSQVNLNVFSMDCYAGLRNIHGYIWWFFKPVNIIWDDGG